MADNTVINQPTTTGQSIATKDIGGINHEQVLLEFSDGAGGAIEVSATNPLPVDKSGLATSTKQSDGSQKSQVVDGSGNVISSTGNALDVNLKSGTTGLALDATLTGGTQQTKITDGTNIANTLKGDGTSAGQVAQQIAPSYQSQAWSVSS